MMASNNIEGQDLRDCVALYAEGLQANKPFKSESIVFRD
jgi:hypothetical protein